MPKEEPASPLVILGRAVASRPLDLLLVMLPVALAARYFEVGDLWIFIASALAIIPLAGLMGRATENLAVTLGLTPFFPAPSESVRDMVEAIREPEGAGAAVVIETAAEH